MLRFPFAVLLIIGMFSLVSCNNPAPEEEKSITDEMVMDDNTDQVGDNDTPIEMSPMPESADFPNATIKGVTYKAGTFNYSLANYELGMQTPDADSKMCANSAEGQHIHLIVDTDPYIAKYEPTFDQAVSNGNHYVLSFLSRSYHESLKHASAYKAMKVNAMNGAFASTSDITEPMLFYSRPKGTYTGKKETENVMLDFYLLNLELGDEYKVKATVNEQEFIIDEWKPFYLKGLPMGENTVTLTLIDAEGQTVQTPLNPVTRTFTLQELPTEVTQ